MFFPWKIIKFFLGKQKITNEGVFIRPSMSFSLVFVEPVCLATRAVCETLPPPIA